jgi:hypothetical protein
MAMERKAPGEPWGMGAREGTGKEIPEKGAEA